MTGLGECVKMKMKKDVQEAEDKETDRQLAATSLMGHKCSLCLFPQGWTEKNKCEVPVPTSKLRRKNIEFCFITVIHIMLRVHQTASHAKQQQPY